MNVTEINPSSLKTLAVYVESTVVLTLITAWVMIALQDYSSFHPGGRNIMQRIAWPILYAYAQLGRMMDRVKDSFQRQRDRLIRGAP